jgi:hypothetical protein
MGGMKTTGYAQTVRLSAVAVLLLLSLSACAGGGGTAQSSAGGARSEVEVGQTDEARPAAHEAESAVGEMDVPESGGVGAGEQPFDRKIVKTAELGLRAEDVRGAAAEAQQVAARFGGSVQSSQISRGEGFVSADLVLSVPSEEFEGALDALRGLGEEVTTDAVSGEDVTEEFVDLESRERNLVAAEESLLALYDRAESVEDALEIERELTDIRGQIEQVQGRIQYLERRTDLSEITLNIQPVIEPVASRPAWDPAQVVARAWGASLGVLQAIATAAISTVVFGWWLAPAFVAGLLWWRRRNRDSSPAAREPS